MRVDRFATAAVSRGVFQNRVAAMAVLLAVLYVGSYVGMRLESLSHAKYGSFSLKESRGQRVGRFFLNAGDGPGVLDVVYAPLKAVDRRLTGEEVFFGPRADEALFLLR